MEDQIEALKNKALAAKSNIKKEGLTIMIGDDEQNFRISGVGQKAVKIEKYVKYDAIIEAVEAGKVDGIEMALKEVIENTEDEEIIEEDE
ncbi:MAG: hypothetical protein ACRC1M_00695 [Methanobacteriaceae archaeon]